MAISSGKNVKFWVIIMNLRDGRLDGFTMTRKNTFRETIYTLRKRMKINFILW